MSVTYKDLHGMRVPVVPESRPSDPALGHRHSAVGKPCPYCQRTMRFDGVSQNPTRDHTIPQSKGGTELMWVCWACNMAKGNKMPEEWTAYMEANPRWWERRTMSVEQGYERTMRILREGRSAKRNRP
jgi:5-methylcytosine-specific restriction endonuclease McrA